MRSAMMPLKVVKILLLATVIGICSGQDCSLPNNYDLEVVIKDIFNESKPLIDVLSFHPVCLAFGEVQNRYRAVSVVVNYTCSGASTCSSGISEEQIESDCVAGVWSNMVLGVTQNNRSQNPQASFTTTARENCAFCASPDHELIDFFSPDSVTHCVGWYVTR